MVISAIWNFIKLWKARNGYKLPLFDSNFCILPKFWCPKFRTLDCFRENSSRIKVRLKKKHEGKQDNDTQKLYSNFSKDFARMKNKSIQKFHLDIKIC